METDKNEEQKKKFFGMLGLSMRAGKLSFGSERVVESARGSKNVRLVFLSEFASENTKKRILNCCGYYRIPCRFLDVDEGEIGHAIGKSGDIAAVAVLDAGFAKALSGFGRSAFQSGHQEQFEGKAGE